MTEVYEYQRGAILVGNEDVIYFRYYLDSKASYDVMHYSCDADVL